MLPSTGHFKALGCPFLESGLCERPHCHYRHLRRDGTAPVLLQQLVSEAVKKVLQSKRSGEPLPPSLASEAVRELDSAPPAPPTRPTYNPTPIAELRRLGPAADPRPPGRRHIPVPYTPHRPTRVQVRRVTSTSDDADDRGPEAATAEGGTARPPDSGFRYLPGSAGDPSPAPYSPAATGALAFGPGPPTERAGYSPARPRGARSDSAPRYRPTPLDRPPRVAAEDPSDEDGEPRAKRPRPDADDGGRESLAGLGDLSSEFEIIGQILDDERADREEPKGADADGAKGRERKPESKSKSGEERRERRRDASDSKRASEKKSSSSGRRRSGAEKSESEKRGRSESGKREKSESDRRGSRSSGKSSGSGSGSRRESRKDDSASKKSRGESESKRKESERKSEADRRPKEKKETVELTFECDGECVEIVSSSDEEAIEEECLRIFEEYVPQAKVAVAPPVEAPDSSADDSRPSKRRVAHAADRPALLEAPRAPLPNHRARAVQSMVNRHEKVKQFHEERAKAAAAAATTTARTTAPVAPEPRAPSDRPAGASGGSKVRIAHVPYVSTLISAKRALPKPPEAAKPTAVRTATKGAARVAHMPGEKFSDRPGVLEPMTSKVALNVRTKYLNAMIDECLKIYPTAEDAYARALEEELAASKKCSTVSIFKNSAVLAIAKLRRERGEAASGGCPNAVSHGRILDGEAARRVSWSIENKYKRDAREADEFAGVKFYENVSKWLLSESELRDNGFPRPHPDGEKGRAVIHTRNTRQRPPKGDLRTCSRCKREYRVDRKNVAVVAEECIYHPNNKYRFKGEVKYQCCGQDATSDGCLSASCHVYEYVDYENLRGYVTTLPGDAGRPDLAVYALDCEMCYTTNGLDLTRVTVVDSSCKVVYESLVRPIHPIIDYNTRYSGLTEEIMSDCTTTLPEVQATFLHMFSDRTILVGHSLESDFKALKLIHGAVVDTSVLFPHKMGPPYKRALRNLTSEYLRKIIQNSVDGHDSAEDATVCMELLIWKLKEELKIR